MQFVVPESVIVQEGVRLQPEHDDEDGGDVVEDRAGGGGDAGESEGIATGSAKAHQHQHQHRSGPHQSELQSQPHTHPQPQPQRQPPHLHIHSPIPIPHHPLDTIATPSPDSHASHDLHDLASYTVAISPSNAAYETALDGLLSLGNDHHYAPPPPPQQQPSQPQPQSQPQLQPQPPTSSSRTLETESYFGSPPTIPPTHPYSPPTPLEAITKPSSSSSAGTFQNCAHLPQDRAVQLLRHYRYNIAPWLDIGDTAQSFGLAVPRIAVDSPPVLDALLALSAATLNHHPGPQLRDHHFSAAVTSDPGASGLDLLHGAVTFAFSVLHRHAVLAPTSWQSPSKNMAYALLNFPAFQEQYPSIDLALSWVTLRLGKLKSPAYC